MKRREFITLLGGAAVWLLAARAQQDGRVRVVGILIAAPANDPQFEIRVAAVRETLSNLGWIEGRNLRTDFATGRATPSECMMEQWHWSPRCPT
jgi:putative ABC transport system substrate-binding protein